MKGNAKNYSGNDSRNYAPAKEYDKGDLRTALGGGLLAGGISMSISGVCSKELLTKVVGGVFMGSGAYLLVDGLCAGRSKNYMSGKGDF